MLAKVFAAVFLAAAAVAAPPRCLTPEEVDDSLYNFVLQARQYPRYVLTTDGPKLASQVEDVEHAEWFLGFEGTERPYQLRSESPPDVYRGSAQNGWRVNITANHDPEPQSDQVLCCVTGVNQPIRCSAKGDGSLYGSKAWINADGTLSLGPARAQPKTAKDVTFIVRSSETFDFSGN